MQCERNKMDTKLDVPLYEGKQLMFGKWREKFEIYCYTRSFRECLFKDGDSNLPIAMEDSFQKILVLKN